MADAPRGCAVTQPNGSIPPGQASNPGASEANYLGNGKLWTVLPPDGVLRAAARPSGTISEKFPWWRGLQGALQIRGRRLDGNAPPLRARIPSGYEASGFQSSGIIFPTGGCWRVTGRAGGASLSFVLLVQAL